jgi:hypothetical protein
MGSVFAGELGGSVPEIAQSLEIDHPFVALS